MTEVVHEIFALIEQVVFWLTVTIYFIFGVTVVWLVGFVRRHLGLDANSIELRRIRRILEGQSSEK